MVEGGRISRESLEALAKIGWEAYISGWNLPVQDDWEVLDDLSQHQNILSTKAILEALGLKVVDL